MNETTAYVILAALLLGFLVSLAFIGKKSDDEQLRLKIEAGLVQKIEGGTVIWTKP